MKGLNSRKWLHSLLLGGLLCFAALRPAPAAVVTYTANLATSTINDYDTVTGQITPLLNFGTRTGEIDSLVYVTDPSLHLLVYSLETSGALGRYDYVNHINQVNPDIPLGGGTVPKDLALAPDGLSVIVAENSAFQAVKVGNLGSAGGPYLVPGFLTTVTQKPDGVVFDAAGHLFMVGDNTLYQMDPVTGAVLQAVVIDGLSGAQLDGLLYDPVHNALWSTDFFQDVFFRVNLSGCPGAPGGSCLFVPADITRTATNGQIGSPAVTAQGAFIATMGTQHYNFDGIVMDQAGDTIYIAARNSSDQHNAAIMQYTLGGADGTLGAFSLTGSTATCSVVGTGSFAGQCLTPGADDPAQVLENEIHSTPEPASMLLCGVGLVGLALSLRKRAGRV